MWGVITQISNPNRSTYCTTTLKNTPQDPWSGALPSQYPCHPCISITLFLEVFYHFCTIVIRSRQDLPHVFERGDCCERSILGLKGPLYTLPNILFCQPLYPPLQLLVTLSGGDVLPINGIIGNHNVALGAGGTGPSGCNGYGGRGK